MALGQEYNVEVCAEVSLGGSSCSLGLTWGSVRCAPDGHLLACCPVVRHLYISRDGSYYFVIV